MVERVSEGLLYEAKRQRRAQLLAVGTAAPPDEYTQMQVADLLQISGAAVPTASS